MRLISLHDDTVRLLERLRIPYDDLTPDGLWGSPYHLVGLTAEQRAVLDTWNLDVSDLTPAMIAGLGAANGHGGEVRAPRRPAPEVRPEPPRESARPTQNAPSAPTTSSNQPAVMAAEPKHHGDPLGDAAGEREMVGRAAAAAEVGSVASSERSGNGAGAATAPREEPAKIRVSIGGKYKEAAVKKGKIVLDGQSFDSPAQAAKSVAPAKGDWVFWEYFDAEAGKWRMLDRDWRPGTAT
ncbi:MAG TPA: hypothetical protein VGM67_12915 [Gemmatimonadaceae bacterium]|jgi:hypothetical protein